MYLLYVLPSFLLMIALGLLLFHFTRRRRMPDGGMTPRAPGSGESPVFGKPEHEKQHRQS